ncbi:MAG: diguanylate cyclase [Phycisphaerae bacterium]|nr:diguanylate cyclase [Phycisphaerae bacterium]MDP7287597.1 diguanylate cyclase [Phycisphaerae bacterium]
MRILIAEDDPVARRLLEGTLASWGHEVVVTCNGTEAMAVLKSSNSPKLAILDWMMPGLNGLEICQRIRKLNKEEYVYVIVLTHRDNSTDIRECMVAGADDYIAKPFKPGELEARIFAAKRIVDLHEKFIEAQNQLQQQATHDCLTGLWNRSGIMEILNRELHRSQRDNTSIAVLLGDLDHFKSVNDNYGHKTGDAVLKEVADRMTAALRPYDCYGRYGGEEFLAVVPRCDITFAREVAERIGRNISSKPIVCDGREISITMSIGVTSVCGASPEDADAIIHAADEALYAAKENGRNGVAVIESPLLVGDAA